MSQTPLRLDGVPIIGNAHQAIKPLEFVEQCRDHSSPVVRATAGPKTLYVVLRPRLVKEVLTSHDGRYQKPEHIRYGIDNFDGDIDTSVTSRLRSAWGPVMSRDNIKAYSGRLMGLVDEFLARWDTGTARNVHEEFRELCLRLACEVLLDVESPLTSGQYSEMVDGFSQRFSPKNVAMVELLPDWALKLSDREYRQARLLLDTFLDDIHDEAQPTSGTVLSSLLDASKNPNSKVSESIARNEVGVLLVGAMEPLAVGLAIACHQIAARSDVQAKLYREARDVVEGTTATLSDIQELQYAEQVFREALRLHPPLYTMFRETKEHVSLGSYELEPDAQVWLPQWAIHRDPSNFDNPETYDPSRWDGEREHHPFAYFPFGGGPRHCPARRLSLMLAKLVLATLSLRYELAPAATDTLEVRPELALRPMTGVDIVFSAR
ncbi:cytochrome P450 (plasmid) [Haloferax sp. S1W]|uniref:cytochrome P450 n=1 Tax=Haloferax sp. S1W TaxID=3377110 RepID=UPI0037CA34ED